MAKNLNINLNEIKLNELHKLGTLPKVLLAGAIAVFIVVLAYFALYRDQLSQIDELVEKENSLKETYTQKSAQAANLDALEQELAQINATYHILLKQLPTEAEIPNLIQELHQAAASNGLRMDSVTPDPVVKDGTIQRLPYKISFSGDYNQITQFTRDVGKLSRIVTLDSLNLKKDDKSGNISFSAVANTYQSLPSNDGDNKDGEGQSKN